MRIILPGPGAKTGLAARLGGELIRYGFSVEETKNAAHYITSKMGGRGAVREICDIILKSQGKWEKATGKFLLSGV